MTNKATPRKRSDEVIGCLTNGMSQVRTAKHLGISLSTVVRIVRENREEIEEARALQAQRVAAELKDRALYAAQRLEDLMHSPNDAVAISAVRTALAEGLRWFDAIEMDRRLAALEERTGLRVVS